MFRTGKFQVSGAGKKRCFFKKRVGYLFDGGGINLQTFVNKTKRYNEKAPVSFSNWCIRSLQ